MKDKLTGPKSLRVSFVSVGWPDEGGQGNETENKGILSIREGERTTSHLFLRLLSLSLHSHISHSITAVLIYFYSESTSNLDAYVL